MQTIKGIPFPNGGHASVLGMTRNGKTYATLQTLAKEKKGVLFFNLQHEDVPKEFIEADGNSPLENVVLLLEAGDKIDFRPSTKLEVATIQLSVLIDALFDGQKRKLKIAIDEVHLYGKDGQAALMRVATAGLRFGLEGVFITQRPANMNNNLLGQSVQLIVFNLQEQDREYLMRHKYPVGIMMEKINSQKYHFVVYEQNEVKGAYKLG